MVLLFLPGLDLTVLNEHSEQAPFLSSLAKRKDISTVLRTGKRQLAGKYVQTVIINQKTIKCKVDPFIGKVGIEEYIMTEAQLLANNFDIRHYPGCIQTKNHKKGLPIVALDCEMVKTDNGSELARISITNPDLQIIYDKFVKPVGEIIDYLTQ